MEKSVVFKKKIIRKIIHTITCIYKKKKKYQEMIFLYLILIHLNISWTSAHHWDCVFENSRMEIVTSNIDRAFGNLNKIPLEKKGTDLHFVRVNAIGTLITLDTHSNEGVNAI